MAAAIAGEVFRGDAVRDAGQIYGVWFLAVRVPVAALLAIMMLTVDAAGGGGGGGSLPRW